MDYQDLVSLKLVFYTQMAIIHYLLPYAKINDIAVISLRPFVDFALVWRYHSAMYVVTFLPYNMGNVEEFSY